MLTGFIFQIRELALSLMQILLALDVALGLQSARGIITVATLCVEDRTGSCLALDIRTLYGTFLSFVENKAQVAFFETQETLSKATLTLLLTMLLILDGVVVVVVMFKRTGVAVAVGGC